MRRVLSPSLLDPRNGADFDLAPPAVPRRIYVVLSTPRTASTMLCRSLWDIGTVGAPKEYCNPMQLRDWTIRFSSSRLHRAAVGSLPGRLLVGWERAQPHRARRSHIQQVLRYRTGRNGVFGLKLQPDQLRRWFGDLAGLERALGPARLIRLTRNDRDAQVGSFVHALRSGQWSATDRQSRIRMPVSQRWAERHIDRQERLLDSLTEGTTPLRITTEALVHDFDASLRRVLQYLGEPFDGPLSGPSQRRQQRG